MQTMFSLKMEKKPGISISPTFLIFLPARAFGELLHRLNGEVGADSPVSAEDDRHDSQKRHVVLEARKSEHDQPVSGSSLLNLNVTGCEQGAALCDLVEADQKDVDDEGDEQELHGHGEAFSEDFLNTFLNGVLSVVRIDDGRGQVEAVLKTCKDRTEVGSQSAGTCIQDEHADDGL